MAPNLNPCSFLPRRLQIVASLTAFIVICIVFLGTSSNETVEKIPYGPQLQEGMQHAKEEAHHIVEQYNPFGTPAHTPPPEQANSSSGETRWYSDWKWRSPFSSSTTFDEERAVLPPLAKRPHIYTYYDVSARRKDELSRDAEQQLLQIWRRAWWAQGFKPVVLSKSEAMHNPLYRTVQVMDLDRAIENELMRWLAWGTMGGGILSNFLALPMSAYDDPMLSFLRRGEYPHLTRYQTLGSGLFIGSKGDVDAALKEALHSPALKRVKFLEEAFPPDTLRVDTQQGAIAFYSNDTITEKYPLIKEKLQDPATIGEGLSLLPSLINSHLHLNWQNTFSKGIAVLKPLPERSTFMIDTAIEIARTLTQCPPSPIPSSCPPNKPKCKPCVSNSIKMTTPKVFRNDSALYTIGTVPHPYTMQSLVKQKGDLDLRFIRRETDRDIWIKAATNELLGHGPSAFARLPPFKDAVASPFGSPRSLWISAERPFSQDNEKDREELDWIFGFELPREHIVLGTSSTPVPGKRPDPPAPEYGDGKPPTEKELEIEKSLLANGAGFIRTGRKGTPSAQKQIRSQIEAWNLADTEAWKFIRAFNARRSMERRKWDEDERSYQGKGVLDRWFDN